MTLETAFAAGRGTKDRLATIFGANPGAKFPPEPFNIRLQTIDSGQDCARASSGADVASRFGHEALAREERRVEQAAEIERSAVGKERDDRVPRAHVARDAHGGGNVDPRRTADE